MVQEMSDHHIWQLHLADQERHVEPEVHLRYVNLMFSVGVGGITDLWCVLRVVMSFANVLLIKAVCFPLQVQSLYRLDIYIAF